MRDLLNLGQMLSVHARLRRNDLGARDLDRRLTFGQWNDRSCRLANALLGIGLRKGDRFAVLAYNTLEWAELYMAASKAGLIALPINFRLVGPEVKFIVENARAAAIIVQDELAGVVEEIRRELSVPDGNYIHFGQRPCPAGYRDYEQLLSAASSAEPAQPVAPTDPWTLMYTSGTTGSPKGVIRNNLSGATLSLVTELELGLHRTDGGLLVMPMCHANSVNFFGAFAYCGGVTFIYSRKNFDPEHCVRTIAEGGSTFTSLVPTHYIMMLSLPDAVRGAHDLSRMTKLMVSSAPARQETKREIMGMFKNSGLFELYGATEIGWATMLHPHEQYTKLGSVGRECIGSAPIRLLDEAGNEVPDGESGELYCNTPYLFDRYWELPEKTAAAFSGEYASVGDMARRDEDGYIHLVDRKSNLIISGGENIYPSEVEGVIGAHPKVKDVAVVGLLDEKWGERVHAAVVLRDGAEATDGDLADWCKERLAGFKRPRGFTFLGDDDMPRNATGKVLHRVLKAKLQS
ncbi:MAG: AMP-binding protein [Acetobacteraceae bacterium]|nr:AMP-binding protein [Acetobacteraceae bacterium]